MPDNSSPPRGGQGFPTENLDGTPALVGKDEYTIWEAQQRLNKDHSTVTVGNIADLHRAGAGSPAPFADTTISPAQHEAARGEWTRETERVGTLSAPPPPEPAENDAPNVVDPGSVSPQIKE